MRGERHGEGQTEKDKGRQQKKTHTTADEGREEKRHQRNGKEYELFQSPHDARPYDGGGASSRTGHTTSNGNMMALDGWHETTTDNLAARRGHDAALRAQRPSDGRHLLLVGCFGSCALLCLLAVCVVGL